MIGAFQRVKAGQALEISAEVWNAMGLAAKDWHNRQGGLPTGSELSRLDNSSVRVIVYNNTGSDLAQWAIVGLGSPMYLPSASGEVMHAHNSYAVATPSASGLFGVCESGIPNGTCGLAVVSGVTPCKLTVSDSGDTHAGPTTSTTELTTGTSGPARIIYKASGTGAGKNGVVFINNLIASAASIEYDSATLDITDGGSPGTPTYTGTGTFEIDNWTQVSAGSVSRPEFPSTGYWRVDVTLTGRIKISGGSARAGVLSAYLAGNIDAPGSIDGIIAGAYAPNASGEFEAFGTCVLSAIYEISDVSDTGNIIIYGVAQHVAGAGSPTVHSFVHPITAGGVSEPQFNSWIVMTKLGDI